MRLLNLLKHGCGNGEGLVYNKKGLYNDMMQESKMLGTVECFAFIFQN